MLPSLVGEGITAAKRQHPYPAYRDDNPQDGSDPHQDDDVGGVSMITVRISSYDSAIVLEKLFSDGSIEKEGLWENGNLIQVVSKEENLIEITGDNLKHIIWHIGNRHLPCQIEENRILIQDDAVIPDMILKLKVGRNMPRPRGEIKKGEN